MTFKESAGLEKRLEKEERERLDLIRSRLPKAIEYYQGAKHGSHYIGNGNDGFVFKMVNADDPMDGKLDNVAVKVWEPNYQSREHELNMHELASNISSDLFTVPELYVADTLHRGFAMENIKGKTPYQLLFKERRQLERGLFEDILAAFRELNKHGVCHADAHFQNYLLVNPEIEEHRGKPVIVDAEVCIIDFGRSERANKPEKDLYQVRADLAGKVVDVY